MSLMARMKKASFVNNASELSKSEIFKGTELISTPIPMLNVAFSGKLDGGFGRGLHQFAGPSKHFKSNMSLVLCKAFLDKYEDGLLIFYDSEFGSTEDYFETAGIDPSRVLHVPIADIEELNFDLNKKLEEISKEDKVMIYVDSIGNLASRKEAQDALDAKSVTDMTRAKSLKGMFRIITPKLTLKDVPMLCVNHSYQSIEMYSKTIVGGGTGIEYSSHTVLVMGKRQIKEGSELTGFEFVLNANKSRFIKERSVIPITVTFEGGIDPYSGLLDVAVATGHVVRPNNRTYLRNINGVLDEDTKWTRKQLNCGEFWDDILADETFKDAVYKMYSLTSSSSFNLEEDGTLRIEDQADIKFDPETGEILE